MDKKPNYWQWTETQWRNPDLPGWAGRTLTAGVDVGSTSTQAVLLADGEILSYSSIHTGSNSVNSAVDALNAALEGTGITRNDIVLMITPLKAIMVLRGVFSFSGPA